MPFCSRFGAPLQNNRQGGSPPKLRRGSAPWERNRIIILPFSIWRFLPSSLYMLEGLFRLKECLAPYPPPLDRHTSLFYDHEGPASSSGSFLSPWADALCAQAGKWEATRTGHGVPGPRPVRLLNSACCVLRGITRVYILCLSILTVWHGMISDPIVPSH